jgi:hypothetical protein
MPIVLRLGVMIALRGGHGARFLVWLCLLLAVGRAGACTVLAAPKATLVPGRLVAEPWRPR